MHCKPSASGVKDTLVTSARDPLFGRLQTIHSSGQEVFVIGPASMDQSELPVSVHAVTDSYPAVARAWDQGVRVNLVQLEIAGYVQDPSGNDALRVELSIRGIFGEPRVSRSFGAIVDLCVQSGSGNELAWHARVASES